MQHGPLGNVLNRAGQGPLKWLGDCIKTEQVPCQLLRSIGQQGTRLVLFDVTCAMI